MALELGDLSEAGNDLHLWGSDRGRKILFVIPNEAVRDGWGIWSDRNWRAAAEVKRRWSDVRSACEWAYEARQDERSQPLRIRLSAADIA